ncbi:DUF1569 domain-containing protein [Ideonella sp. 4Y16]|uniref:DUF1569 domain-containing protein n=1 Tax=Ideonella alba TaxID=2824118 RepID=A0A940YFA6_9BURK|nr:DUF1569 domain-containing protein [Ideonella alba]MBQ0932201.1 DUF1569 domain-containing protein [Ideonella alba]MBQ0943706.1 DUF1569 domain-containing protein [Ideonella alba]
MSRLRWHDFDAALTGLAALPRSSLPAVVEGRTLAQALLHCAQGIEYSMQGFPQPKPRWFQLSVGALAFAVFRRRGWMSHDRRAPVPGEPPPPDHADEAQALARLHSAIAAFRAWPGPWSPHFAYGALDRAGHEQAHAMHLADHLQAFLAE